MSFGLLKANLSPVALDFGAAALKALQVQDGERPALLAAAAIDTPDELIGKPAERLAHQMAAVPTLLRAGGFRGKRAVCSLSATQTLVQHMHVPRMHGVSSEEQVRERLRILMNRDPSRLIVRQVEVTEIVRNGVKGAEIICFAMPREIVFTYMEALRRCKLEVIGIHSEHIAGMRCFDAITRRDCDEDLISMYIDMGYVTTKLMVARGRHLLVARTLPIGGRDIDVAEAQRGRGAVAEVRAQRAAAPAPAALCEVGAAGQMGQAGERPGIGAAPLQKVHSAGQAAPACEQQPAERIAEIIRDEMELCGRYFAALFEGKKLDRLVFFGGAARDDAACRTIARSLDIKAYVCEPLGALARQGGAVVSGVDIERPQPGWAVALGMCLAPTDQ